MAGLINELINTLDDLNVIYGELIKTGEEKKKVIIANNIDSLHSINDKENVLLGKSIRLNKKRAELFNDIAFVLNKNPDGFTLSTIIECINGQPEAAEVRKIRNKTEALLKELKTLNEQNKTLIEFSLEHVDYSVNLMRSALSGRPSYYDSAGNELPSTDRFFDVRQ